jgi:hypothetical protein
MTSAAFAPPLFGRSTSTSRWASARTIDRATSTSAAICNPAPTDLGASWWGIADPGRTASPAEGVRSSEPHRFDVLTAPNITAIAPYALWVRQIHRTRQRDSSNQSGVGRPHTRGVVLWRVLAAAAVGTTYSPPSRLRPSVWRRRRRRRPGSHWVHDELGVGRRRIPGRPSTGARGQRTPYDASRRPRVGRSTVTPRLIDRCGRLANARGQGQSLLHGDDVRPPDAV